MVSTPPLRGINDKRMEGLEAISEALRHMRENGVRHVYVTDDAMARLQTQAPPPSEPRTTEPPRESPVRIPVETTDTAPAPERKAAAAHSAPKRKPLPEPPPVVELPEGTAEARMAHLRDIVHACPACNEHLSAKGRIVFGSGNPEADVFFCGEAPGQDEERSGEPFVGKAGQLLTKIIEAMGLSRNDVYIANILKWRPEHDKPYGNRPPTPEEMNFCLPYLRAQLDIVRPRAIVALGNTAVTGLLGPDPNRRLGRIRGDWREFEGIPMMPTYHPSYLLRNDTLKTKRQLWEDMLAVMEKVDLAISEKQRGFFLPRS